ncbi:MAG: pilus assembly protein TadG-related protein [Candidatus Limnocylindria bacterium]
MSGRRARWRGDEGGQAIVFIAITTMAMLFAVGLAVDAGQLFVARRTAQEAADAGAYAGAVVLWQGGTQAEAVSAATVDAERNGYVDGGDGGLTDVTVSSPPTSGPFSEAAIGATAASRYVEVVITTQVRTTLVPAQGLLNTVRVRGVAGAEPLNNAFALMALDRGNTPNALQIGPYGDVHLDGGGILVNSTSSTAAVNQQSDPDRFTITAPHGTTVAGSGCCGFPNLEQNQPQVPDPFAGYPKPSTSGMPVYNSLPGGMSPTLQPGVYTVSISAAGGSTFTLNPGIYILKAGLNATGNADFVNNVDSNGGVFIFNTTSNYPDAGGTCGSLDFSGTSSTDLTPMTTGTYRNMLIYQDPACTAEMAIRGTGAASFTGQGTLYLPNAHVRFDGNPSTLNGSQLVARTIDIQNGNISIDFDPALTAQPILPRLSE